MALNAGATRFNSDSSQLEIYDGNQWTGILSTSPELQTGGTRGIAAGGGGSNGIVYHILSTSGRSITFGNLINNDSGKGVASSRTRMIFAGGYSGNNKYNNMEFVTISSTGDGTDFADLHAARGRIAGGASATRGIFCGSGIDSPAATLNSIEFCTIASTGINGNDFGDMTSGRSRHAAFGSPTRLIIAGGYNYSAGGMSEMDYITIASTGNASDFGDLTEDIHWNASACNAVRGLSMGASPGVNVVNFVTINSIGNAKDFGDLTVARRGGFGASSKTRAILMSGYTGSAYTNTIDKCEIMTTGNFVDFTDADITRGFGTSGVASNGHGGL